jgi:LysM repeat protein
MYLSIHRPFSLFISLLFCVRMMAAAPNTGDSTRYLTLRDSVTLYFVENEVKVFDHVLSRKQTLYSLARFYGIALEELYKFNPTLKSKPTEVGQRIRVPVPNPAIRRYRKGDFKPWKFVPAYYKVRVGDDLKKIADNHFRISLDTLVQRNHLTTKQVSTGQLLLIGYVSVEGIPDSLRKEDGHAAGNVRHVMAMNKFKTEIQGKKLREQRGPAYWSKKALLQPKGEDLIHEFFVLHRSATVNSTVEVTNPVTGATAYAKVIGKIPNIYGPDIVIILSIPLAKQLGAVDERFFVKIRYQ